MKQELVYVNGSRVLSKALGPAHRSDATCLAHLGQPVLDWLDRQLLDAYQRDFPICETPFAEIASHLHCRASEVLRRLTMLKRHGVVSRVGPVFAPGCIGASTLAAMAVPQARVESVAQWVNRYRAVSHVHEREHEFNLWFVLAAPNAGELYDTLIDIRHRTGLSVLDLRLERAYDMGFESPLWRQAPTGRCSVVGGGGSSGRGPHLDASDRCLVGAIQDGLPLTQRPYAVVANRTGLSEAQVMEGIRRLLREGTITRMGVVVHDHELGGRTDTMVVFDVPCARVDMIGERLARVATVTRCYRRIRRSPVWPYNLYCMLDTRDRAEVMGRVDNLLPDMAGDLRRTVLFGRRRFRQRDARSVPDHLLLQSKQPAPWMHWEI